MNSKSVYSQDKSGSAAADLKKLFSSHVLENTTLQKQKADFDSAKVKKLKELNFNEKAFLRKYEKYTVGGSVRPRARRGSIDVGLARSLELRYNSRPSTGCSRQDLNSNNSVSSLTRAEGDKASIVVGLTRQQSSQNTDENACVGSVTSRARRGSLDVGLVNGSDLLNSNRSVPQRLRRGSVDAGLARTAEVKLNISRPTTSCTNRDNLVKSRSLARDAINSDCPYSFDTWNTLVGSGTDVIEHKKREILYGDSERILLVRSRSTDEIPSNEHIMYANDRLLKESRLLPRRKLKPLNMDSAENDFDDDTLDAEIMEIQSRRKPYNGGRRHSVATVNHRLTDMGMKLPSIESSVRNSDKKKSSSDEGLSKSVSTEDLGPLKVHSRRRNTTNNTASSDIPDVQSSDVSGTVDSSFSGLERLKAPKRPVANATIFVQGDTGKNETLEKEQDTNNNVVKLDNELIEEIKSLCDQKSPRSEKTNNSGFLPAITVNSARITLGEGTALNSSKRVKFREETSEEQTDSDGEVRGTRSGGRLCRNSMTTATLKLLVDSQHGAAKLRYIAMLAHEMEKEEAAKHTPTNSPEPDPYEQLTNCRYLRLGRRQDDSFVEG